jgi:hypothetical protein
MRELNKKQLIQIWDKKSHTVEVEEADHHQAEMEASQGEDPKVESQRTIPVAASLWR